MCISVFRNQYDSLYSCWQSLFLLIFLIPVDSLYSWWQSLFLSAVLIPVDSPYSCWQSLFLLTVLIPVVLIPVDSAYSCCSYSCWQSLFLSVRTPLPSLVKATERRPLTSDVNLLSGIWRLSFDSSVLSSLFHFLASPLALSVVSFFCWWSVLLTLFLENSPRVFVKT